MFSCCLYGLYGYFENEDSDPRVRVRVRTRGVIYQFTTCGDGRHWYIYSVKSGFYLSVRIRLNTYTQGSFFSDIRPIMLRAHIVLVVAGIVWIRCIHFDAVNAVAVGIVCIVCSVCLFGHFSESWISMSVQEDYCFPCPSSFIYLILE